MKVGDLVTAKDHACGIYGINFETGEYIRIKPNAPPLIITKLIPKDERYRDTEAEVYLSWRNEKCRVARCDMVVVSVGSNQ